MAAPLHQMEIVSSTQYSTVYRYTVLYCVSIYVGLLHTMTIWYLWKMYFLQEFQAQVRNVFLVLASAG